MHAAPIYASSRADAWHAPRPAATMPGWGTTAGWAGLGLLGLAAGGPLLQWGAPIGGAWLGWTRGSELLRSTGIGQSMVGWLSTTPIGGMLGRDPYKPVGGALGALAGFALGNLVR